VAVSSLPRHSSSVRWVGCKRWRSRRQGTAFTYPSAEVVTLTGRLDFAARVKTNSQYRPNGSQSDEDEELHGWAGATFRPAAADPEGRSRIAGVRNARCPPKRSHRRKPRPRLSAKSDVRNSGGGSRRRYKPLARATIAERWRWLLSNVWPRCLVTLVPLRTAAASSRQAASTARRPAASATGARTASRPRAPVGTSTASAIASCRRPQRRGLLSSRSPPARARRRDLAGSSPAAGVSRRGSRTTDGEPLERHTATRWRSQRPARRPLPIAWTSMASAPTPPASLSVCVGAADTGLARSVTVSASQQVTPSPRA
jgi:hypothetical protein